VVQGVRSGLAGAVRDVRDAHTGPKPNSRPVPDWLRSLAWFLDESVPLPGGRRVGPEGMVSFIPGIGDVAGLAVSMVVVVAGIGAGVSIPTTLRMMLHVGIDALAGAVPFIGAFFDMGYKANTRNLRLIEADLADRAATRRSSLRILAGIVLAVVLWVLLTAVVFVLSVYLFVRFLDRWF
jgi:hypothetical protein